VHPLVSSGLLLEELWNEHARLGAKRQDITVDMYVQGFKDLRREKESQVRRFPFQRPIHSRLCQADQGQWNDAQQSVGATPVPTVC
jgi:hypothetical protein